MPKLLEVAPRIAGSMALSRMRGVNHALLHVYAHLGRPFSVLPLAHEVVLDRAPGNRYRAALDYRRVYLTWTTPCCWRAWSTRCWRRCSTSGPHAEPRWCW